MQKRDLILLLAFIALILALYLYVPAFKNEITGLATSSQVGNLSLDITTYIACTWSDAALNVSFGTNLNPGRNDYNGTKNYDQPGNGTAYNVTIDPLGNKQVNISVKGDHLISGINKIYIGNVTWFSNTTASNGTNMIPVGSKVMLTSYDKNTTNWVATNLDITNTTWYRFWIDLPAAQIAGSYLGNYTMLCEEAN
jgi:hypothetical protein